MALRGERQFEMDLFNRNGKGSITEPKSKEPQAAQGKGAPQQSNVEWVECFGPNGEYIEGEAWGGPYHENLGYKCNYGSIDVADLIN